MTHVVCMSAVEVTILPRRQRARDAASLFCLLQHRSAAARRREARIAEQDPRRDLGAADLRLRPTPTMLQTRPRRFFPCQLTFTAVVSSKMWASCRKHTHERVLCSRGRLRRLSTLNPCHSLAAMLARCLNDGYLFSVSVVARANARIGERAVGYDFWTFKDGPRQTSGV